MHQLLAIPTHQYIAPLEDLERPLDARFARDFPFHQSEGPSLSSLQGGVASNAAELGMGRGPGRPRHPEDSRPLVKQADDVREVLRHCDVEALIQGRPWSRETFKLIVENLNRRLAFYDAQHLNKLVDKVCFERMDTGGDALEVPNSYALNRFLVKQKDLPTFTSLEDVQRYLLKCTPAMKAPLNLLLNVRKTFEPWAHLPTFSAVSPDGRPRPAPSHRLQHRLDESAVGVPTANETPPAVR